MVKTLKKKNEYQNVFRSGRKQVGRLMVIYAVLNGLQDNRYGIIASKKVGNSVVRNRAKRRVRELIRKLEIDMKTGFDIVLIARPKIGTAGFEDILIEGKQLLKRAGLYGKNSD